MSTYISSPCSCICCKQLKTSKGIHTHFERSHGTDAQKSKYSSGNNGKYAETAIITKRNNKIRKDAALAEYLKSPTLCKVCNTSLRYEQRKLTFCSVSCANTLRTPATWSKEQRAAQSIKIQALWEIDTYATTVMSNNKRFTSKNEVIIRDYFIKTYPNDEWTFGGGVRHSGLLMSRDLFSRKLRISFEYDGIWHFKNITGQLLLKQQKDAAFEKWCIENNYSLVRLDEQWFMSGKIKIVDLENIFKTIKPGTITKLGDRY